MMIAGFPVPGLLVAGSAREGASARARARAKRPSDFQACQLVHACTYLRRCAFEVSAQRGALARPVLFSFWGGESFGEDFDELSCASCGHRSATMICSTGRVLVPE